MKTQYRFIEFLNAKPAGVDGWACVNRNARSTPLGGCTYYKPWKEWVFSAESDAVFSQSCLADIRDFLLQLNREATK